MVAEICSNEERVDVRLGIGFCGSRYDPDLVVKLGGLHQGVMVDAAEALHYSIAPTSEYSDMGVAPSNIWTVSNAVTAKALRGRR